VSRETGGNEASRNGLVSDLPPEMLTARLATLSLAVCDPASVWLHRIPSSLRAPSAAPLTSSRARLGLVCTSQSSTRPTSAFSQAQHDRAPTNSVGCQISPLPWTRFYFSDALSPSPSNNPFYHHFDVANEPRVDGAAAQSSSGLSVRVPDCLAHV
jgi:hypothetical protein